MEIEAQLVSPLNKYYPNALLDEHGRIISVAKAIPGGECLGDNDRALAIFRQSKRGKNISDCQDYGLFCAHENGNRKVVIADGVSSTVAAQSVANLITHRTMKGLLAMDGKPLDKDAIFEILENDNLDLACRFFREKFMTELAESIRLNLHKEKYINNADMGFYGATTLSYMRLEDEDLDILIYGTGGYLVFRNNEIVASYGKKEKKPAQIAVDGKLERNRIHSFSMKVKKGDFAIMFTDGLFG